MKKILAIILVLLTVCACGGTKGAYTVEEGEEPEELMGGWYYNPDLPATNDAVADAAITKDESNMYVPLLELGTQVVAGTNHLYLCYSNDFGFTASDAFCVVKVYEDLSNKAEITDVYKFDILNYVDNEEENTPDDLAGGWTDNVDGLNNMLDAELSEMFTKAFEGWTGVTYEPICMLASQVVAGTNYAILAKGTTVTAEPVTHLYIVTIYEKFDGSSAEIKNISGLNLADIK